MSSQYAGLQWAIETKTARSVWTFDRVYRSCNFNMPLACSQFFSQANIGFQIDRPWTTSSNSILFFSDHKTALDGFALSLACPSHVPLQRVIFAVTAIVFGKEFMRRNILVYPKGSYRNLQSCNSTFWNKMIYFATHRWGPFAPNHTATQTICRTLHDGSSVSILPSGIVGEERWRSGIGAVLLESPQFNHEQMPMFAAPVYLEWSESSRSVHIQSPGIVRFSTIRKRASHCTNRFQLTQWIQDRYIQRDWDFA